MDDLTDLTSMSKVTDLNQEGQLLSWGCGEFGQHGHGGSGENVGSEDALVDHVDSANTSHRIKHISCGASHSAVVTDQDEILTWGNGNSGQLGCGDKATHTSPQRLRLGSHDSTVAGVACGSRHTVVWLKNGRAYSCGNNFYAQLGYDFRIKNYKENQVLPHFLRPIMHRKVVQVSCGEKFTLFLFETGQVAGCGANSFGQLGNGTRAEGVSPKPLDDPENIVSIAAGSCHSLAVTATGELYVWGMGRACGSRRDDLLVPHRKTTRRSNVVGVAGGSGHSLALTANGTVYSWGGGVDGQLGHGEDVTYLAQPKALADDVFPGRVAQVACGDSYSAALLGDGSLYMWGKSSHVIQTDQPSSQKVFRPVGIPLKGRSVAMVSCGSWHTAAITGKPERQPLEEDSDTSEEDEEEDLDTLITMETDDGIDAFQDRAGSVWEMSDEIHTDKTSAVSNPVQSPLRPPYRLAREGTTLTLEEFYSSTPVPVRPRELPGVRVPERKRTAKAEVQGEDDCVDDKVTVAESERDEGESSDYSSADDDLEADKTESAAMAPPMGSTGEPEIMDRDASLKTEQDRSFTKTEKLSKKFNPQHQRDTYLSRSKTMGSIDIPKKSVSKQNQPTVYNMSAMSGSGDADRALSGKFVVDKHVAIQSRKASHLSSASSSSASSSSSSKRIESSTKQTIPTVGLVSTDSVDLPPSNDRVPKSMPMPKMTRAHTLYGPMRTHGKIRHSKSESPPVIYPVPPVVSMAYKTRPSIVRDGGHPTAKSKYGTKDKALKDLKQHHQTGNAGETASQKKTAGGRRPLGATSSSQKRPVFSSAGSWRQRSEVEDVLLRDGTPPGSPLQRKTSTKDS